MADYPEKGLALSELVELIQGGANLKIERPEQRIYQFGELVSLLKELISMNIQRVEADNARNQAQLEVLATLQALIRKQNVTKSHPVDLLPLKTVLSEIRQNTQPAHHHGYEFNIERNQQTGYLEKIIATPHSPRKH